jgi:hypothetical protein
MVSAAPLAAGTGAVVGGLIELVIFGGWGLLFAVMLIFGAFMFAARRRVARQRASRRGARPARVRAVPTGLTALREADPRFDEQLLLDAARTSTLLVFAATTTGDVAPLGRLVTDEFWRTPFGRITAMTARDRRREARQSAKDAAIRGHRARPRWNVPLDYQPSVPELVAIRLRGHQQVTVRVSFDQLVGVVRPGAADMAAAATATSFSGAIARAGRSAMTQGRSSVSWMSAGGRYDLTFVRPAGTQTDPEAALADRTCQTCGATYRSELTIGCAHCRAPRALPWGTWRLASAVPVQ